MTQSANETVEVEVPESTPEAQTPEVENPQPENNDFDPKERVEITDPKVQKKFNHIYKQMKASDTRNQMYMDLLERQQKEIDEMKARFSQTDTAEAERVLLGRMKEASETGDEEKAHKIMLELIDLRAENKMKSLQQPKEIKKQIPEYDPDVQTVVKYAQEADASGNPLRPWLVQGHPQHENAMRLAGAVAMQVNADLGYVDVEEVFTRMDEAMKKKAAPQTSTRAPEPMRGGLTNNQTRGKIKLSPQELAICQKMNVKPEEYVKWKR